MRMQTFKKGSTILRQGAQVGEEDRMYLLAAGEVDVVISGGRASEDHQARLHADASWGGTSTHAPFVQCDVVTRKVSANARP